MPPNPWATAAICIAIPRIPQTFPVPSAGLYDSLRIRHHRDDERCAVRRITGFVDALSSLPAAIAPCSRTALKRSALPLQSQKNATVAWTYGPAPHPRTQDVLQLFTRWRGFSQREALRRLINSSSASI